MWGSIANHARQDTGTCQLWEGRSRTVFRATAIITRVYATLKQEDVYVSTTLLVKIANYALEGIMEMLWQVRSFV